VCFVRGRRWQQAPGEFGEQQAVEDEVGRGALTAQVAGLECLVGHLVPAVVAGLIERLTGQHVGPVSQRQGPDAAEPGTIGGACRVDGAAGDRDPVDPIGNPRPPRRDVADRVGPGRIATVRDQRNVGIGIFGGDGRDLAHERPCPVVLIQRGDDRCNRPAESCELGLARLEERDASPAQVADRRALVVRPGDRCVPGPGGRLHYPVALLCRQGVVALLAQGQHEHFGPEHDVRGDLAGLG
jgi:hypothetical protein